MEIMISQPAGNVFLCHHPPLQYCPGRHCGPQQRRSTGRFAIHI